MARLRELISDVDVFIQGYRYGSLERRGLGLSTMLKLAAKRSKGIVYVDESCYGPDGPFAERSGWQRIGDAASGTSYVIGRSLGPEPGHSVLPPLPVSDMTAGVVGALGAMVAIRDRALKGGSFHVVTSLVAADTISLEREIRLYPPSVVAETVKRSGFVPSTPGQSVSEIMIQVIDGWKKDLPTLVNESSELLTEYEGPWGKQKILTSVARLDDDDATPRWTSPSVPNCHHSRDIKWL
ncbi:hypothetical protein ASPCAL01348 [Aspergillus calidoustus]|uniref:Alpha methylacyl-CoA racemase n=1 Tax=Aspergillus calidoustus TaxID=454130 RepID=A0A0U5C2P1_ASPCI|nr:hypothetical protein ASPCAL01348 [Aspergillus calidoustus]